jgi:hypothetical protein
MFKKVMLLLILVVTLSALFSASQAGCLFLSIDPSATSRGMGGGSSVADAWHQSPSIGWSNPGMAALHNGLQVGYIQDKWFEEAEIDDLYYYSSYANMTYRGIGVTVPLLSNRYNGKSLWGNSITYGDMHRYDEHGILIASFKSYETASRYTIAFNPFNYYFKSDQDIIKPLDLGIGFTYTSILSDLSPESTGSTEIESKGSGRSASVDFGMILKYKLHEYLAYQTIELEASFGMTKTNIFERKIIYGNEDRKYPLPEVLRNGVGFYFALPNTGYGYLSDLATYFPHIFSAMGTIAVESDLIAESSIDAYGMEFGICDFLYYRVGRYSDEDGHITGNSEGYGIRLNLGSLISVEANWAKFPGGDLAKHQKMNDFMLNLDIVEILKLRSL